MPPNSSIIERYKLKIGGKVSGLKTVRPVEVKPDIDSNRASEKLVLL